MQYAYANHWEQIYTSEPEETLSWHQSAPSLSFELIQQFARRGSSVIDIGGGSSALAGMLVEEEFHLALFSIFQDRTRLGEEPPGTIDPAKDPLAFRRYSRCAGSSSL